MLVRDPTVSLQLPFQIELQSAMKTTTDGSAKEADQGQTMQSCAPASEGTSAPSHRDRLNGTPAELTAGLEITELVRVQTRRRARRARTYK